MTGLKVFEYAKEIGIETLALMDKLREWNIPIRSHMAELDEATRALIQQKMKEAKAAPAAKKTARKKAEPAAKKAATKVTEKKAAPKKAAAKPAAKTKKAEKVAEETSSSKTAAKSSMGVIRRRASEMAEAREPEEKIIEVVAAPVVETVVVEEPAPVEVEAAPIIVEVPTAPVVEVAPIAAPPVEAPAAVVAPVTPIQAAPAPTPAPPAAARRPPGKREVVVGASGASSPEPMLRRNIIGKMDLSRAVPPPRTTQGGPPRPGGGYNQGGPSRPGGGGGYAPGGARPQQQQRLRPGFAPAQVAVDIMSQKEDHRKVGDDKKRRTDSVLEDRTVKEGEAPPLFVATEFRKREMIFQPKKKKDLLNRLALKTVLTTPSAHKRVVKIHDKISVGEFAKAMGVKSAQLITHLMKNGITATQNTELDFDTTALIAPEFKFEVENIKISSLQAAKSLAFGDVEATVILRPPIVTVMGHVDHGKTSLLDAIRKADVVSGEAGGITQHIGAYSVKLESGHQVTFIDTPGHAAFTAMRARGANVTDIAIIVVAADDGVMPQTAEAINHAKAAGVPIIVALNKMDKPGVNVERIKQQLTEFELVPEEWGGTTIFCPVSAIKKEGIKELLEQVHLVAEVAELKANPKRSGTGVVIESKMEKGRGVVVTLLVKDGTVKVGQAIVAGQTYGRVRAMLDDKGKPVKEAGPSQAVEVLGLQDTAQAGDTFDICESDSAAEEMANLRREEFQKTTATPNSKMSLETLFSKVQSGDVKELPVILKTDMAGSAEAIRGMLEKEAREKVKIKLVHVAVGAISESDVLLASTAKGIVIGFNVRPDTTAQSAAKREGIEIKTYSIIYELVDDIKNAMAGLLEPTIIEKTLGHAEVRNTFTVPKVGMIAGCFVKDGKIQRSGLARLLRDGRVIYEGKISSLKRFKDDAREVAAGFECGIGIENYNDLKVGDQIEAFEKEVIQAQL